MVTADRGKEHRSPRLAELAIAANDITMVFAVKDVTTSRSGAVTR
jgi:hypothetical protein